MQSHLISFAKMVKFELGILSQFCLISREAEPVPGSKPACPEWRFPGATYAGATYTQ